jgi:hypothetical protein
VPTEQHKGVSIRLREGAAMLLLSVVLGAYLLLAGGVAVYLASAVLQPVSDAAAK